MDVNALTFDVFGTVVDWRSGVIREGRRQFPDADVDWPAFADAWRETYRPSMDEIRDGDREWRTIDELHREAVEELVEQFGLETDAAERDELNRAWHRLDPWPDVLPGLRRLRSDYFRTTLSNGNVRLLANMAKRAGLPWDLILSAELSGHYKPDREVYRTAAELLDEDPGDVLMVAAHEHDLDGAAAAGLRTAYVHRPQMWGPDGDVSWPERDAYDIVVEDFEALASVLGC
ncbi:MAG: haloacid dehalogenase type II [Salinirussus sp.]